MALKISYLLMRWLFGLVALVSILADALVRADGAVMLLVFGQDGAQVH